MDDDTFTIDVLYVYEKMLYAVNMEFEREDVVTFRDVRRELQRQGYKRLFTSHVGHASEGNPVKEFTELNCDTPISTYGIRSGDTLTFTVQEKHYDMPLVCLPGIVPDIKVGTGFNVYQYTPTYPHFDGHSSDCLCDERKTLRLDRFPWFSTTQRTVKFLWEYLKIGRSSYPLMRCVSIWNSNGEECQLGFDSVYERGLTEASVVGEWDYGEYELRINTKQDPARLNPFRLSIGDVETHQSITIPFQISPVIFYDCVTLIESYKRLRSSLLMDLWLLVFSFLVVS